MLPTFVTDSQHPNYGMFNLDWLKYRLAYEGGRLFINQYLEKFSDFETNAQFGRRKHISYCPAFSKAAINEVRNSIYQRFVDIKRIDGSDAYKNAVAGKDGGVDRHGNTMNSFMGCQILPELMVMGKVGIYIDAPPLNGPTKADNNGHRPYIYYYRAEDILNWVEDEYQNISSVLLRERIYNRDERGFPTSIRERYRHAYQTEEGVFVEFYEDEKTEPIRLNLTRLPFVKMSISHSLMVDIADYQISLLNLASSDMSFVLNTNFAVYVEQYSPVADLQNVLKQNIQFEDDTTGSQASSEVSGGQAVKMGLMTGRRYPVGTDAPTFISPSTECLTASMAKQEQLKAEIRLLLNLSIANLQPKRQSVDSKVQDDRPLENGLGYIGLELEHCERQIAEIWADYEGSKEQASVHYPHNYSMKTEEDAQIEADEIEKNLHNIPSMTYQKELGKRVARLRLGCNVSIETMQKVEKEIDNSVTMNSDPEVIAKDIEGGLVSLDLASKMRGYPEGEVEKAAEQHAEKLARIAKYQSTGGINGSARGVNDLANDPKGSKQEKTASKDTSNSINPVDNSRGAGK